MKRASADAAHPVDVVGPICETGDFLGFARDLAIEEGDLLDHVRHWQDYYLGCVFAVIRAWHAHGQPRTKETRHDFREWAQIVDWIVQNIFQTVPLMDGHQQAQERVSNPALVWLRSVVLAVNAFAYVLRGWAETRWG